MILKERLWIGHIWVPAQTEVSILHWMENGDAMVLVGNSLRVRVDHDHCGPLLAEEK